MKYMEFCRRTNLDPVALVVFAFLCLVVAFSGAVARGAEPTVRLFTQPCPVTGGDCKCGCSDGRACQCAGELRWRSDPTTPDRGLWRGEEFVGRYFAAEKVYRPVVNGRFGDPVPVPKLPYEMVAVAAPVPVAAPVYLQPAFYPSFGGGCPSGRCGSR